MIGRFNSRVTGLDHLGRNGRHHGRAGMYNAVQSAFAVPSFNLPLVNMSSGVFSIAPTTALGSSTPTYTRATAATTIDFEGLIKTCLSGEVRCLGGRRVYNSVNTSSENFNTSAWIANDGAHYGGGATIATLTSGQTDPFGGTTAYRMQANNGGAGYSFIVNGTSGGVSGRTYAWSIWAKSNTGSNQTVSFYGAQAGTQNLITVTPTWKRFSVTQLFADDAGIRFGTNSGATQSIDILIYGAQREDVTGQSNQNPSEYVSVGVLSAPVYHGVGVDGVKVFTTLNGNTVASNVVTEATGLPITSARAECAGGVTAGVVDAVGPVGYLAEGARTNFAQNVANGSATALTRTAGAAIAPDGTLTAVSLVPNTATSGHDWAAFQTSGGTSAGKWTVSLSVKPNGYPRFGIRIYDGTSYFIRATVDITNGTMVSLAAGTATITAQPNGYYYLTFTGTSVAGFSSSAYTIESLPSGKVVQDSFTGDGTSGMYVWGANIENAAFASTYIPTTTIAVARNADVLTYPFAGNAIEASGAFYAEVSSQWTVGADGFSSMVVGFGGGTQISPMENTFTIPATQFQCSDGTTNGGKSGLSSTATGVRKRATSWSPAGMICTGDGIAPNAAVAYNGSFGSTGVGVGCNPNGSLQQWCGTIRNFRIYPRAMTAAQLASMTA